MSPDAPEISHRVGRELRTDDLVKIKAEFARLHCSHECGCHQLLETELINYNPSSELKL
jgi:hypothetical protein